MADQATEERAVALVKVAEGAEGHGPPPVYIIGYGSARAGRGAEPPDRWRCRDRKRRFGQSKSHEKAFNEAGLEAAFERTIGVVVQPGVEFASTEVIPYKPEKAPRLAGALADLPGFVLKRTRPTISRPPALPPWSRTGSRF